MLPDSPKCTAVRADMKENRLNSRFQYIHENESVRARVGVYEESVVSQDKYHLNKY